MNLAEYRRAATRLADYLPWAALVAEGIVLNKDGSFQRSARFRGPDLDSAVAAELVAVSARINSAFRRLGSGWCIFVEAQRHEAAHYPDDLFPDPASALVDAERKADFEEKGAHFVSSYFLTFLYLPPAEEAARTEAWLYEGRERSGVDPREALHALRRLGLPASCRITSEHPSNACYSSTERPQLSLWPDWRHATMEADRGL